MYTNLLTYLNTRQFFTNRWHGDVFDNSFYLTDKELQAYNVTRAQLEAMPQIKTVGINRYNVQGVESIDISLLKPHGQPLTDLHRYMMRCVVSTSLPTTVQATAYWNAFMKHRNVFPELFFSVDRFAGRVHSPISGMSKDIRPYLILQGDAVVSFDVAQMQPTLLANILYDSIGKNEFSDTINAGTDIYTMLQEKAGLSTRNEAKKLFFQMIFGKPSQNLERLFDGANFIQWVNWYKKQIDPRNPHSKEKTYSNLAWVLQTYEVRVMGEVWANLAKANIPFLTVHDEIIGMQSDTQKIDAVMQSVLSKHFKAYKLNVDKIQEPEQVAEVRRVNSTRVRAMCSENAATKAQPAPEPINKKSFFDIGMDILGEQNNMTKNRLLAEMIRKYNITDTRAAAGFDLLLNNGIIEPTHIGTYVLSWSTPF